MTIARHILTTATLLGVVASPALAQTVNVRVKVDKQAVREMVKDVQVTVHESVKEAMVTAREAMQDAREAVRSALGPEFRRDVSDAVRDIADAFAGLADRDWSGDWEQSQRFRATQNDRETRRFTIGDNGQLDLDTLSGDITVRPASGRDVVIELIRTARGVDEAAARNGLARVRVQTEERNGRVTVRTVYPDGRQRDYSVSVDYVVSAPPGTRISTHSISGDVSVRGIDGELSIDTTSGDVDVTDAKRLTSARTVSGDLRLTNVGAEGLLEGATMSGDIVASGLNARRLDLGTISGGVTARNVSAGDVKLKSMSDDVVFEGSLTSRGRYEFSSHSGDVRVTVTGNVGFSFDASTFSGTVRGGSGVQVDSSATRRSATRRIQGTAGDGSAVISVTTFSGDVVISRK